MSAEKKRVMTFGTFDHLHAGHEFYLNEAKKLGTELVVIVARDETVRNVKGQWPDTPETLRAARIKALGVANDVVIGNNGKEKYQVIKKFRPDVIALGYDQYAFTQLIQKTLIECKLNAHIVRIPAYKPHLYKSSLIRTHHEPTNEHGVSTRRKTQLQEPVQE